MCGRLVGSGRIYPCYAGAQELERKRKVLLTRGLPPVYDRAGLKLTDEDRARLEAEGSRPHWRFRLDHERMVEWTALIRGPSHLDPKLTSDPVVRREDGSWLYMIPYVIYDSDMGIPHFLWGEDTAPHSGIPNQMYR